MKVCDQFTDPQYGRFFIPTNYEAEVHSSVDLTGTPAVIDVGIDLPVAIIGDTDPAALPRGSRPKRVDHNELGVRLAQGERIVGLQSYRETDVQTSLSRDFMDANDLTVFGSDLGVSRMSLSGLTHAVVTVDWMSLPHSRVLNEESPFSRNGAAILPLGEPLPVIDEAFRGLEGFVVRAFIDSKNRMVAWRAARDGGWLVDLCVINTYAHNRVELHALKSAIGPEAALNGLLNVNDPVAAYLRHFDEDAKQNGGLTFTPSAEPTLSGYGRKFPQMTRRERSVWHRQQDAARKAMTLRDRSDLK